VTSEPAEMRRHAVSFYTDLFKAEGCDVEAADELLQGLPQLSPAESDTLGSDITLEELTSAEKAFDRVDHTFLAATLQAFGVGEHFLSW
ncbi:hypothetical protein JOQ06_009687, partial [Pogonophryne albipinna]